MIVRGSRSPRVLLRRLHRWGGALVLLTLVPPLLWAEEEKAMTPERGVIAHRSVVWRDLSDIGNVPVGVLHRGAVVEILDSTIFTPPGPGESRIRWYRVEWRGLIGWIPGSRVSSGVTPPAPPADAVEHNLVWFYERFGESTWGWTGKLAKEPLTEDECQQLVQTARRERVDEVTRWDVRAALEALIIGPYVKLKEDPADAQYRRVKDVLWSEEFVALTIKHGFGRVAQYLPDSWWSEERFSSLVRQHGVSGAFFYLYLPAALKERPVVYETAWEDQSQGAWLFCRLPEKFRRRRDVIVEAVRRDCASFWCVDEELRKDRALVLQAMKVNPCAYYAAKKLLPADDEIRALYDPKKCEGTCACANDCY